MNDETALQTLQPPNATVPKTRMVNASAAQAHVRRRIDADRTRRAYKRYCVEGLIDGRPPYSPSQLKKFGQKQVTNINWMTAQSYVAQAAGMIEDLVTENPTNFLIETGYDKEGEDLRVLLSEKITKHSHDVLNEDSRWQMTRQCSIWEMVKHGCGPLFFENIYSVMPHSVKPGELMVPERAKADTAYWEEAQILMDYKPVDLWKFIANADAAKAAGWDVPYTRWCIMNASPRVMATSTTDWEDYERQYKNGSLEVYDDQDAIRVAHCFWVEFEASDKLITYAIIEQQTGASINPTAMRALGLNSNQTDEAVRYLYFYRGRYKDWGQVIHPMYYNRGNGTHWSVNGLGQAMYGALSVENRFLCKLADEGFSPRRMFKPSTDSAPQFSLEQLGDAAILPAGWEHIAVGIPGVMADGLAMHNTLTTVLANNLAQYRQTWRNRPGNPPTLGQVEIEHGEQYRMANTQINRLFKQLDSFYAEVIRRLCLPGNSDPLAKEFRKRCTDDGVPAEALKDIVRVEAYRVAGQGSPVQRQMAMQKLYAVSGGFPESGQDNVKKDFIASLVGYRGIERYYPRGAKELMGTQQEAQAALQIASAYTGMPPVVTPEQDPAVFAPAFLGAAGQSLGTVPQGADPMKVIGFVDTIMPAALTHIQRLARDPLKQDLAKELMKTFEQTASVTDRLKKSVADAQAQQQQQEQEQPQPPQIPPEQQAKIAGKQAETAQKLQQKDMAFRQKMAQTDQKHQLEMARKMQDAKVETAVADMKTSADILRENVEANTLRE